MKKPAPYKTRFMGPTLAAQNVRASAPPAPKVADAHYQTKAHRDWAAKVVGRANRRCQGRKPDGQPCGRIGIRLYADHIIELRDGGAPFDLRNGQALCGTCHSRKTHAEREKRNAWME